MRTIHDHISVENNKHIREYKIYYYKDLNKSIDSSNILSLRIDIDSSKLNLDEQEFMSTAKLNKYLEKVADTGKISGYNRRDILNLLEIFNSTDTYDGIEVILPYYDEAYDNSDIEEVYDMFVEKLHIELDKGQIDE